jgi:hypothetical protein
MPNIWQDLALRNTVAAKTIRDQTSRFVLQSLEQPLEETLGGICVPPILHQDVEHDAVLVHRTPEIVQLTVDPDEHLIQVPDVAWSWPAPAEPLGELRPELSAPSADALVGHKHAPFGQDQLDIPQAQAEHVI